jgi:hypothetical protein
MDLGVSKTIYYFKSEGRQNLKMTVQLAVKRAEEIGITHIIVFTANGEGAYLLRELIGDNSPIKIHAATFPYKQEFSNKEQDGTRTKFIADTSREETREQLAIKNINLIQAAMPLQDIIIPGAPDIKTQTINYTLSLISGGLKLCVQAILMANDSGHVEPGDQVIAMSADTAIVARGCISKLLFHPAKGLEISEIICKPDQFTITHPKDV